MTAQPPRIFVVEDEALIAMELSDHLRQLGYQVCGHAARAKAALRDIPKAKPDLVLLDINLGPGPSGLDVAETLVATLDVPIIILTAYSDPAIIDRAARGELFAYLVKPFKPLMLRANIDMSLRRHAAERAVRAANRKLVASEARFRRVTEHISDALFVDDCQGDLVYANNRFLDLFEIDRSALTSWRLHDWVASEFVEAVRGRRRQCLAGESVAASFQCQGRRRDGSPVWLECDIIQVCDDSGAVIGTQSVLRDITDRIEAEQRRAALEIQLRDAQRLKSLGTLAGGIAHDFNNLLHAISLNLLLARRQVSAQHPIVERLDQLNIASKRATELVRQILAFSQQQPLAPSVVPLAPILKEAHTLLRAAIPTRIKLNMQIRPEAPPHALVDATQLHQVLMNLGTNAWHAIDPGTGEITLSLERVSVTTDAMLHPDLQAGRYALISVSDDGVGIDAARLQNIFDPFYTTKQVGTGTGLGLSIVHGIVKDHNGVIAVDSKPGEGSTFRVYLPEVEPVTRASEAQAGLVVGGGSGHILCVDDEPAVVAGMLGLLELLGYRATGCHGASEALEAIRSRAGQFDALITDYNMPETSGVELAREISREFSGLPIILATGYHDRTGAEIADSGICDIIVKPFSPERLLEVLRAHVPGAKTVAKTVRHMGD